MMTTENMIMYDQLVELGIATADEINLAFNVACANWETVLERVLYSRTGCRNIQQYIEEYEED